jgi:hypothetical protein
MAHGCNHDALLDNDRCMHCSSIFDRVALASHRVERPRESLAASDPRRWKMNTSKSSVALTVALAIASLGGGLAFAQGTHGNGTQTEVGEAAHPTYAVNQQFVRRAAGNCRYSGSVTGNIEVIRTVRFGGMRYRPDLEVNGKVECADGFVKQIEPQRVRGEWMTRREIEQGLEAVGRIHVHHGMQVCTITPAFVWRGGQITVARSFPEECEFVRGGGPEH